MCFPSDRTPSVLEDEEGEKEEEEVVEEVTKEELNISGGSSKDLLGKLYFFVSIALEEINSNIKYANV